jgi:hypothetical protein
METLAFPVLLELAPSRRLRIFLWVAHGLAAAGGLFSPWPLWGQALFLLFLVWNFWTALRALARQPKRLILAADGRLRLSHASDLTDDAPENQLLARPASGALALPWLIVFSWRGEETPVGGTLVLLADSFKADGVDNLRRLNIWLRWGQKSS